MVRITVYGENELGVPAEWPSRIFLLPEGETAPQGWVVMSEAELADYIATRQPAYDAWASAQVEAVSVPEEVAAWRLRVVVERAGLKPIIDAVIASLEPDDQMVAREAYYGGTTIRRDSPLVGAVVQIAQLTQQQKDDLFVQANGLPG